MVEIKNINSKEEKLKQEILSIKNRELLVKYASLATIIVPALIVAAQSVGAAVPLLTPIMLTLALLSLTCTIFSIVNKKIVKKKEEELGNFNSTPQSKTFFQEHWLELIVNGAVVLNALDCMRSTTKMLNTDDYFSLALSVLEVIGELLGSGVLLIGNVLGCISSIKSINKKVQEKNSEIIVPCLMLTGSSLLLGRRIALITTLAVPSNPIIAAVGVIGFACIIIGCAINIHSYRSKLNDVTVKQIEREPGPVVSTCAA